MRSRCCSAALLVLCLIVASPVSADEPASAKEQEAAELAKAGTALFKEQKIDEALAEFLKSIELHAIPVVAWNIARCYEESEKPEDAIRFFKRFRDLTTELDRKKIATTKIERLLKRYFGLLTLDVDPIGADVLIDSKIVGQAPLKSFPVRTGMHSIDLRVKGYEDLNRVVQIAPEKHLELSLALTPKPASLRFEGPTAITGVRVFLDQQFKAIGRVPGSLTLDTSPGVHTLEVLPGDGFKPINKQVNVQPGGEIVLTIEAAASAVVATPPEQVVVEKKPDASAVTKAQAAKVEPPKLKRGPNIVAGVLLGTGLAAAAGGGVMHVMGFSNWKKVTDAKKDGGGKVIGVTRAEALDSASSSRTQYIVAYALYGAGAATVLTSVILYATGAGAGTVEAPQAAVLPMPVVGGAGLSFEGRF
jgi:hypothetical protein